MNAPALEEYVYEDANLLEALHQLILYRNQSLLARNNNDDIVGILRLSDIFDKIAQTIESCGQ